MAGMFGQGFGMVQGNHGALGTAADGAAKMGEGGWPGAAGQDELLEHGQVAVEILDDGFESGDLGRFHDRHAGQAEFAAKIEEIMLDIMQHAAHVIWQVLAQQHAEAGVEFIDIADGCDTQTVLGRPVAVAEAGGAGVTRTRDNPGEPVALAFLFVGLLIFVVHAAFSLVCPELYFPAHPQTVAAMPKFAANLSFLFTDVPFPERFARAADAGFAGVEYLFPYDWAAGDIGAWLAAAGVEQVLFNLPPGDWENGERGLACLPDRRAAFIDGVQQALTYAMALDCRRVHCMAGLRPAAVSESVLETTYVANLRHAADCFASIGATVLIEPINSRIDMPGYWLDDVAKALRLLDAIGRDNVRLQLDLYHAQIIQGDLARAITSALPRIGHIQIADNPGRHEPGTGEIHYPFLFELLDRLAYDGWVGCEYKPLAGTEAGLGWRERTRTG